MLSVLLAAAGAALLERMFTALGTLGMVDQVTKRCRCGCTHSMSLIRLASASVKAAQYLSLVLHIDFVCTCASTAKYCSCGTTQCARTSCLKAVDMKDVTCLSSCTQLTALPLPRLLPLSLHMPMFVQGTSRKLVHIIAGLALVLTWPFYR
jgi:hypothetical protein